MDKFTTNAVADRAGVSIGSLYQYFPGKSAIIAGLIRRERDVLQVRVSNAVEKGARLPLHEAVTNLVEAAVAHQLDRPQLARVLDFLEPGLPLSGETAAANSDLVGAVATLLARHGHPRSRDTAQDVVAIAKGMIDSAGIQGETNHRRLRLRVVRAVVGYLGDGKK